MNPSVFSSRRTLGVVAGLIGAAVALSGTPAHAQQSEIDLLRQQLAEMQARLDKLESAKIDVKSITPTVNSASKIPITVGGLLQVQTNNFFNQDAAPLVRAGDSFRLRRGEVRLTAPTVTPRMSGTVMFDLAKATSSRASSTLVRDVNGNITGVTTSINDNQRNNVLQEIVLGYQIQTNPKHPTFLDIGQYKYPIGYEGDLVSSGALQTIERAQIFRESDVLGLAAGLNGSNGGQAGGFGDVREKGLRLRGSITPQFDYQFGVFSGLGERQNTVNDLSDTKALIGRVVYKPTSVVGLQLGLSAARGNNRFVGSSLERTIYNGFGVYKKDKITFQGEYTQGNGKINTGLKKDVDAFYMSLGYLLNPRFELVGRYDHLKRDLVSVVGAAGTNNKTIESTLGINYYLKGNNAKVQANVVDVNNKGAGTDSIVLRTQFQVGF